MRGFHTPSVGKRALFGGALQERKEIGKAEYLISETSHNQNEGFALGSMPRDTSGITRKNDCD